MRWVILGAGGFVGSHLAGFLNTHGHEVLALSRKDLDFLSPADFSGFLLRAGDRIVDCIAKIDGTPPEISAVNVAGLKAFISYLNDTGIAYQYIYLSTYSVLQPDVVMSNAYVQSKFEAEQVIKTLVGKHTIIRLIFPFGKGEGSNRLISRMITKVRNGENILADRLLLNLTPIDELTGHFVETVESGIGEINFSNGVEIFFPDLVSYMFKKLGKEEKMTISNKNISLVAPASFKSAGSKQKIYDTIETMLNG